MEDVPPHVSQPATQTPEAVTSQAASIGGFHAHQAAIATVFQQHIGPLPPPDELAAFGRIQADFPERILRMAEENGADERLRLQREQVQQYRIDMTGRILGFTFAISALATSVWLCLAGHDWAGGSIGAAAVAGTVIALVSGRAGQAGGKKPG